MRAAAQRISQHAVRYNAQCNVQCSVVNTTKKAAFTLIELLVVIGIISVITAVTVPNFNDYIKSQGLNQGQEQVISDIRAVQNKALSGVSYIDDVTKLTNTYWGLKFAQDQKNYFSFVTNAVETDLLTVCINTTFGENSLNLPAEVVVRGVGTRCVFISFETGNAVGTATASSEPLTIVVGELDAIGIDCLGIEINEVGRISKLDSVACNT